MDNSTFVDKFMVVDRCKEGVTMAQFFDSYTGLANCIANYRGEDMKHLIVLRRRHNDALSWRNVPLVPRFTINIPQDSVGYIWLDKVGVDDNVPIPFAIPTQCELHDAVCSRDIEEMYTLILRDYEPMLEHFKLIYSLDPM